MCELVYPLYDCQNIVGYIRLLLNYLGPIVPTYALTSSKLFPSHPTNLYLTDNWQKHICIFSAKIKSPSKSLFTRLFALPHGEHEEELVKSQRSRCNHF